ncbi:response regulator [Zhouia sp. PK063]|uniref:hybrid sensor histidine kinase/response regulator n=1 Tax=Zhouia sp. PK063 TaxID=3373602 RepID=UPI00378E0EC6
METKKPLIIAVDDEQTNLKILSFILEKNNFEFIGIQDSARALPIIQEHTPNLILLDVSMPLINGFQLCEEIKKQETLKEIPVIFVTGKQKVEDKIKGLEVGGVDYVTKPFNEAELRARIKTHLELAAAKIKIENQAKKLENDNRLLNRMFSIIGHDLRSPLSAIKMQLDFIIRGIIDPKADDFTSKTIHSLSTTSDEAFNLLDNLLGWAKSESGVLNVIQEKIQLITIAEQTARLQKMALENKKITLNIHIPKEAIVYADFNTTKTVFVNIVSNAIKFTPREGTIAIAAIPNSLGWKVTITDTGVGMSASQIEKILDPKEHFSKTGTENESGTGLGLILCQDFLEKNKSKLFIDSTEGKGSTFSFVLPKFTS